jgi:hypothetical protein
LAIYLHFLRRRGTGTQFEAPSGGDATYDAPFREGIRDPVPAAVAAALRTNT